MELSIDDMLKESGISEEQQEQKEDDINSIRTDMKQQMDAMKREVEQTTSQLLQQAKDREALIQQTAKMAAYIEATGVGKYDPETGDIVKIAPTIDESKEIETQIKELESDLKKQLADGDIEQSDYWRLLQEKRAPLKERLDELKVDRRIKAVEEKLLKSDTKKEVTDISVVDKYNRIAVEFPDINDTKSELFKEMSRLYEKYPDRYRNANYNDGKGSADQYRELAERARDILEAKGSTVTKRSSIAGQFGSPNNDGYQRRESVKSSISKEDMSMLVGQGINNPTLIKELNNAMIQWNTTGSVTLKD